MNEDRRNDASYYMPVVSGGLRDSRDAQFTSPDWPQLAQLDWMLAEETLDELGLSYLADPP